jgi:hypothetical protein
VIYLQALLIFLFSIGNDLFSVKWHEAREKGRPLLGAFVGVILGTVGWMSLIWVVADSIWLMVPDLVGTAIGSYLGIKWQHAPLPVAIALGFYRKPDPLPEFRVY